MKQYVICYFQEGKYPFFLKDKDNNACFINDGDELEIFTEENGWKKGFIKILNSTEIRFVGDDGFSRTLESNDFFRLEESIIKWKNALA